MKTLLTFCLLFCLSVLSYGQTASPIYDSMQGVSGAEKITNLAEVEADLGRFTNLSATTGILSTANAQTLNVTGNATVNGFNYTASPTLNGASSTESTSTSVVGGIWNGDFSEGEGVSTSSTSYNAELGNSGWWVLHYLHSTPETSIINNTLKMYASASDSNGEIVLYANNNGVIPVLPSTSYRLSYKYKTEAISTTYSGGFYNLYRLWDSTLTQVGSTVVSSYVTGSSDWTTQIITFTTGASVRYIDTQFRLKYESGTVYLDDVKLEQVTTHTNNSTTPTVAYPVITGVSSEFVDQQNTASSSVVTIGDFGGTEYWSAQSFVPTQIKESALSLTRKADSGTPTGNLIIEKRTDNAGAPSSTIIASVDVEVSTLASWSVDTVKTFPIFSLNTPGVKYWYVLRSDVNEGNGNAYNFARSSTTDSYASGGMYNSTNSGASWSAVSNADWTFKTHYAENTRQITLTNSSTGTSTTVDWGDNGLPDGAVVDLYNGTMSWEPLVKSKNSLTHFEKFFTGLVDYSSGSVPPSSLLNASNLSFNGFYLRGDASHDIYGKSGYLTISIPSKYIKSATVTLRIYNSGSTFNIYYSNDNANWTNAHQFNGAFNSYTTFVTDVNSDELYIKISPPLGGSFTFLLSGLKIVSVLDTSKLAPLLLAAGSNTINQSVNGGSYKANVAIKSVSGGFQTTLNEANKQLTVLRNAPRSYLETPDKTTNAIVVDNNELVSISGPVQVNGATIMNASTTPAYDIALPHNSGGAIGSSWNTYSETRYKNIISDVTEASYANIASRLAGVQSKMVTRKIPDAVKAKFFDAEIEWVTDVVSVTEELKTQVVEPVYEAVKLDSKVVLDAKAAEDQLLTAEASPKIVSYVTKEVSVLRSPGEYPRQEFRGWKIRQGVDEATKKQLENLYFKPHPEPIADTAPEAYRVPEGFAWSKWVEESTIYQNWILPQIINELPKLRKRLEALEAMEAVK